MTRRITSLLALALAVTAPGAEPLLTGVIEDGNAQIIEMPSLPGGRIRLVR